MRRRVHSRSIVCDAYACDDGLYEIEASLRDVKPHATEVPGRGLVPAGEPIHDLKIKIAIDEDKRIVKASVDVVDAPFPSCREIGEPYHRLVGLTIRPGFTRQVRKMFKSTSGCTHLTEMLPIIATVVYQISRDRQRGAEDQPGARHDAFFYINSCYSLQTDGENVKRYFPAFYRQEDAAAGNDETASSLAAFSAKSRDAL